MQENESTSAKPLSSSYQQKNSVRFQPQLAQSKLCQQTSSYVSRRNTFFLDLTRRSLFVAQNHEQEGNLRYRVSGTEVKLFQEHTVPILKPNPHNKPRKNSLETSGIKNSFISFLIKECGEEVAQNWSLMSSTEKKSVLIHNISKKLDVKHSKKTKPPSEVEGRIKNMSNPQKSSFRNSLRVLQLKEMSIMDFRNLGTLNKESSQDLQIFMELCKPEVLRIVGQLILRDLHYLVKHPFGNYVVQKQLILDQVFAKKLETLSLKYLTDWAQNEFSSRVLQSVLRHYPTFRKAVFMEYQDKLSLCFESISIVFLLSAAMQASGPKSDLEFLIRDITENPEKWIKNKYSKRLIISFIQIAPLKSLDVLVHKMKIADNMIELLEDKFNVYLIIGLLKREHPLTMISLQNSIRYSFESLFKAKHMMFFINLMVDFEGKIQSFVVSELVRIDTNSMIQLKMRKPHLFRCLLLDTLILISDDSSLDRYIQKVEKSL